MKLHNNVPRVKEAFMKQDLIIECGMTEHNGTVGLANDRLHNCSVGSEGHVLRYVHQPENAGHLTRVHLKFKDDCYMTIPKLKVFNHIKFNIRDMNTMKAAHFPGKIGMVLHFRQRHTRSEKTSGDLEVEGRDEGTIADEELATDEEIELIEPVPDSTIQKNTGQ